MIVRDWPTVLSPAKTTLDLWTPSRSAGPGLGGEEQIVSTGAGLWRMSIELPITDAERALAYRAIIGWLHGRARATLFPVFDAYRPAHALDTTTTASAALRAEEVRLNVTTINDELDVGHYISIADYLYRITAKAAVTGANRLFEISPPLRAAVASSVAVEIGRPRTWFRLAEDASGSLTLDMGRWGRPIVDFVEVVSRG